MTIVGMISVVMPVIVGMIVTIVTMVVTMMIVAVPSSGWDHAAGYDCADNA